MFFSTIFTTEVKTETDLLSYCLKIVFAYPTLHLHACAKRQAPSIIVTHQVTLGSKA